MGRGLLKSHCQYHPRIHTSIIHGSSRCRLTLDYPLILGHFTWRSITFPSKFIFPPALSPRDDAFGFLFSSSFVPVRTEFISIHTFDACDKSSSARPDIYQSNSCIWELLVDCFEVPCSRMLPQAASFAGEATRSFERQRHSIYISLRKRFLVTSSRCQNFQQRYILRTSVL